MQNNNINNAQCLRFKLTCYFISAITSTLSDRIRTNHATVRILQEDFDNDLIELKCNVHPLDGLAITARSTGAEIDKASDIKGACFGSDGTAVNLINVSQQ